MAKPYEVVVTTNAKKDINDILNYLLAEASHKVAVAVRKQLIDGIHGLAKMPSTGQWSGKKTVLFSRERIFESEKSYRKDKA